jgi:hypothetical protein
MVFVGRSAIIASGEKQKRRPKIKDKRQSERFKQAAREVGAEESTEAFDRGLGEVARPKKHDEAK